MGERAEDRLRFYRLGWVHGAGFESFANPHRDYERGYMDGRRAFREAMAAERKELGMRTDATIHPLLAAEGGEA